MSKHFKIKDEPNVTIKFDANRSHKSTMDCIRAGSEFNQEKIKPTWVRLKNSQHKKGSKDLEISVKKLITRNTNNDSKYVFN